MAFDGFVFKFAAPRSSRRGLCRSAMSATEVVNAERHRSVWKLLEVFL